MVRAPPVLLWLMAAFTVTPWGVLCNTGRGCWWKRKHPKTFLRSPRKPPWSAPVLFSGLLKDWGCAFVPSICLEQMWTQQVRYLCTNLLKDAVGKLLAPHCPYPHWALSLTDHVLSLDNFYTLAGLHGFWDPDLANKSKRPDGALSSLQSPSISIIF